MFGEIFGLALAFIFSITTITIELIYDDSEQIEALERLDQELTLLTEDFKSTIDSLLKLNELLGIRSEQNKQVFALLEQRIESWPDMLDDLSVDPNSTEFRTIQAEIADVQRLLKRINETDNLAENSGEQNNSFETE